MSLESQSRLSEHRIALGQSVTSWEDFAKVIEQHTYRPHEALEVVQQERLTLAKYIEGTVLIPDEKYWITRAAEVRGLMVDYPGLRMYAEVIPAPVNDTLRAVVARTDFAAKYGPISSFTARTVQMWLGYVESPIITDIANNHDDRSIMFMLMSKLYPNFHMYYDLNLLKRNRISGPWGAAQFLNRQMQTREFPGKERVLPAFHELVTKPLTRVVNELDTSYEQLSLEDKIRLLQKPLQSFRNGIWLLSDA